MKGRRHIPRQNENLPRSESTTPPINATATVLKDCESPKKPSRKDRQKSVSDKPIFPVPPQPPQAEQYGDRKRDYITPKNLKGRHVIVADAVRSTPPKTRLVYSNSLSHQSPHAMLARQRLVSFNQNKSENYPQFVAEAPEPLVWDIKEEQQYGKALLPIKLPAWIRESLKQKPAPYSPKGPRDPDNNTLDLSSCADVPLKQDTWKTFRMHQECFKIEHYSPRSNILGSVPELDKLETHSPISHRGIYRQTIFKSIPVKQGPQIPSHHDRKSPYLTHRSLGFPTSRQGPTTFRPDEELSKILNSPHELECTTQNKASDDGELVKNSPHNKETTPRDEDSFLIKSSMKSTQTKTEISSSLVDVQKCEKVMGHYHHAPNLKLSPKVDQALPDPIGEESRNSFPLKCSTIQQSAPPTLSSLPIKIVENAGSKIMRERSGVETKLNVRQITQQQQNNSRQIKNLQIPSSTKKEIPTTILTENDRTILSSSRCFSPQGRDQKCSPRSVGIQSSANLNQMINDDTSALLTPSPLAPTKVLIQKENQLSESKASKRPNSSQCIRTTMTFNEPLVVDDNQRHQLIELCRDKKNLKIKIVKLKENMVFLELANNKLKLENTKLNKIESRFKELEMAYQLIKNQLLEEKRNSKHLLKQIENQNWKIELIKIGMMKEKSLKENNNKRLMALRRHSKQQHLEVRDSAVVELKEQKTMSIQSSSAELPQHHHHHTHQQQQVQRPGSLISFGSLTAFASPTTTGYLNTSVQDTTKNSAMISDEEKRDHDDLDNSSSISDIGPNVGAATTTLSFQGVAAPPQF